jgi:ABC-type uncharacterized transport system fused permease/ATPase subunit
MKTLTVKKLDIMSVAKFSAVLGAAVSAMMVVVSWVLALLNYAQLNAYYPNVVSWNTGLGVFAIIIVPLLYAASGFIGGAVLAWFYNVALGGSNGVKFDVTE